MRPLVTAEQMRIVEQSFVDGGGDLDWLMLQAGMQVASRIPAGKPVLFLVGPGNNGGDALIAASVVEERGDDAKAYLYKRTSGPEQAIKADDDADCSKLREELDRAGVVVDGLLGIGRKRPVEGQLAQIIDAANESACRRIAVDLPTGVDADTGAVETVGFRADATVTLGLAK